MIQNLHMVFGPAWLYSIAGTGFPEGLHQCHHGFAHVAFQDAAFIEHHASNSAGLKFFSNFVVGDIDALFHVRLLATNVDIYPRTSGLPARLPGYGQRCENQDIAVCALVDLLPEFKLFQRFPEPVSRKSRTASLCACSSAQCPVENPSWPDSLARFSNPARLISPLF